MTRLADSSLWLVAFGLMLASSGLDGVYMSQWMPPGWGWLGLVLNTMSDLGSITLSYWYTRLRQTSRVGSRRYKLANALLPAEAVAVLYGWFFSWRQLRVVSVGFEPEHWRWVAPIAAGFIPLLLAAMGWAQALLAGKLDAAPEKPKSATPEPAPAEEPQFACKLCSYIGASQHALNAHQRAHRARVAEEVT